MGGGAAQLCEPWLVEQVERARARADLPEVVLECPRPGLVEAHLPADPAVVMRLSGFATGETWVGATLISLVETRASVRASVPPVRAVVDVPPARAASRWSVQVAPSVGFVGTNLQVGGDARVDLGPITAGAGISHHQASTRLGTGSATDFLLGICVPFRPSTFPLVIAPAVAVGAVQLQGQATRTGVLERERVTPVARASVDIAIEPAITSHVGLALGVRLGFRVGRAGAVDGEEVLAGTGLVTGVFFGVGWTP